MNNEKVVKKPTIWVALIPVVALIVMLVFGIVILGQDPHIFIIMGGIVATIVAIFLGHKWDMIEKAFLKTVYISLQACIILLIVGMLIGTWMLSGTIPTMIVYGLKIINPTVFLFVCCLTCSLVSLATGSSWSTAGTIGVAMIGIGTGLHIPAEITAGAVISGAYFGDKMSPLSDTTNLAPAVSGSNLFDHVRHMVFTTGPSLIITLIIFAVMGLKYREGQLNTADIDMIVNSLNDNFVISPLLLIPPVLVICMVAFKISSLPGLMIGTLLGGLFYLMVQPDSYATIGEGLGNVTSVMQNGYISDSGNAAIDDLLTRGGMQGMLKTVSLIFSAMYFGGVMEKSGCLETIADTLLKFAKSVGSLVTVTIISCFVMNVIASDQYLSIVITGRMYNKEFRRRGLAPKNLSRCLEDSATLTSPLVPWNTCGNYMATTLNVPTIDYLPYCFLNLINPFVSIILGYTGLTMDKLTEEEIKKISEEFDDRVED